MMSAKASLASQGTLLGLLSALLYAVFTLLPGSNTMVFSWPWVFVWQVALFLPILWLLWQLWWTPITQFRLGNGLDWLVLLSAVGIVMSTAGSAFHGQALWNAWAAFAFLAALYALTGWLTPERAGKLLLWQGVLGLAFILVSLGLWISQTYLPELARIREIQHYGSQITFNFSQTSLRNWHPIGHQNYVAGYLLLIVPLLLGLGFERQGRQRWLWWGGAALGLVNLYTTSSRGGWLGLVVLAGTSLAVLLWKSRLPRQWLLLIALSGISVLITYTLANNRLRSLLMALLSGKAASGELAYRLITNVTGWHMGTANPLTGTGVGSVPLVYQKYRPAWAGREAELIDQLHSTPANLWGELGIWGALTLLGLGLLMLVTWLRWARQGLSVLPAPLVWSLWGSLLGYSVISLTDYQLNNVCTAGALVLYAALLAAECRWSLNKKITNDSQIPLQQWQRGLALAASGVTLAMGLWLIPVHRAWALSSQGFEALSQSNVGLFVEALTKAHALAPWDAYYSYQLAWNLGELSFQATSAAQQTQARKDAIAWFQTALQSSPYQEFGHSNLGWLQTDEDLTQAIQSFAQSARLVPGKQGVFFGIGFSALLNNQPQIAVEALTLETLRHPLLLTSPLWKLGLFPTIYGQVVERLNQRYEELLAQFSDQPELASYVHQLRGTLHWWQGDIAQARSDWQTSHSNVGNLLLDIITKQPVSLQDYPKTPGTLALAAWLQPEERKALLEQAWVALPEDVPQLDAILPPPEMLNSLVNSMNQSASLEEWLKQKAPAWRPRSERLGYGVISRHIDGPTPVDFLPRIENVPMAKFFSELLDLPRYLPAWDGALQPWRDEVVKQISQ